MDFMALIFCIGFSVAIGKWSESRGHGFWYGFWFSAILSPIIGFLIVWASGKKNETS